MSVFIDFDVYDSNYTYNEMKVMSVMSERYAAEIDDLDYEDLMRIVSSVYNRWVVGRNANDDKRYDKYPWSIIKGEYEDGYIQRRVCTRRGFEQRGIRCIP